MTNEEKKIYEEITNKAMEDLNTSYIKFLKAVSKDVKYILKDEYSINEELVAEWMNDYFKGKGQEISQYLHRQECIIGKKIKIASNALIFITRDLEKYIREKAKKKIGQFEFIDVDSLDFYELNSAIRKNKSNLCDEFDKINLIYNKKIKGIIGLNFLNYEDCLAMARNCSKEDLNRFLNDLPNKFKSIEIYQTLMYRNIGFKASDLPKEFQKQLPSGQVELASTEEVLKNYSQENNNCYEAFFKNCQIDPEMAINNLPESEINYMIYLFVSKYKLSEAFVKRIPTEYQSYRLYSNILLTSNDINYFSLIPQKYQIEIKNQIEAYLMEKEEKKEGKKK